LCLVASLVLLAASAPAAAPKRITGKLNKPGYTVIALAADGRATSVRARRGGFTLRPPADRVTLNLRAPSGKYAGSVVVAGSGKRAVLGVRAGAKIGTVEIRSRKGYARVSKTLPRKWLDRRRWARARKGVPTGAGNFGFVRSRPVRGAVRGDLDLDGVPDALDVDKNGNLILDNAERSGSRAQQKLAVAVQPFFFIHAGMLEGGIFHVVNANATTITPTEVDANLRDRGDLSFYFPGVPPGGTAVLDCRGLVYCSRGGTGRIPYLGDPNNRQPYPDCCLDPTTGFGLLQGVGGSQETLFLAHGATTAQIGTGDVLIEHVFADGAETEVPATVQFVIATHPALASYDDANGNRVTIAYPVRCGQNNPCDTRGGFPVAAGANGDVVARFTFWRPQRSRIRGDKGGPWIDIGHLMYAVRWGGRPEWPACPADAYSELSSNLAPSGGRGFFAWPGVEDLADDTPASPDNTFSFRVNLSRCVSANGATFAPGETQYFVLDAGTENADETTLGVFFTRQQ
jgi:hypothetical protein